MLQISDVSKLYRPGARRALDGVSLSVSPGEIVGLFLSLIHI